MPSKLIKFKEILKIALPSGLSSLLDILNISIALLFIAKLSTAHIVAFGASMNFIMLFYAILTIFFTGTNATIARLFGEKNPQTPQALSSLLISAAFVSLPLFLIAFALFHPYLTWMGLTQHSLTLANIYLHILIFEIPALLLKTTLTSAFSAISCAKIPFYVKICSTLFNVTANYYLIFGFGFIPALDIVGAGIANVLSAYFELFLLLIFAYKKFKFSPSFDFLFVKKAFWIGFPAGIERSLTLFSLVLIAKFLLSYGDEVLAGFQIGGRIEAFAFMPGFGFMVASMSLMGQNVNHPKLAKEYTTLCLWIASMMMGALGALMCIFGQNLAWIFSKDSQVILYAWHYLIAVGLSQIPLIFIFVLDGALKGAGKSKFSLYINTSSIWILRILPMYLCSIFKLPYYFIYLIIFLETYIRATIFWIIFYKIDWKIKK
ncbi:MATE family efflux transporter [Helicobacter pametensis]|uniref:MATE family efflux transporter n=1 Tax=Helicobacter pametensis TaxID=95149 RepID=UPI0004B35DC0|nr:MATE family efflux transporter [Helicobacter pametensis]